MLGFIFFHEGVGKEGRKLLCQLHKGTVSLCKVFLFCLFLIMSSIFFSFKLNILS